jgi:REP element-mobilizing transposase RayT
MTEDACRLDSEQRDVVERQVRETCRIRNWQLYEVNCRSNHLHIVVTADQPPKFVRNQIKAWCTRRLKELEIRRRELQCGAIAEPIRDNWWAERGSQRFINDEDSLEARSFMCATDRTGQETPKPKRRRDCHTNPKR